MPNIGNLSYSTDFFSAVRAGLLKRKRMKMYCRDYGFHTTTSFVTDLQGAHSYALGDLTVASGTVLC